MTSRAHKYLQEKRFWKKILAIYQEDEALAMHMCYFWGYRDYQAKLIKAQ